MAARQSRRVRIPRPRLMVPHAHGWATTSRQADHQEANAPASNDGCGGVLVNTTKPARGWKSLLDFIFAIISFGNQEANPLLIYDNGGG